ncbi:MAG: hypothetical protein ACR2LY_05065 [Thermoleophilaceae bacterium]
MALALFLVLLAAYAATIGLDAVGESAYSGSEPHHLLATHSLVEDGDLDVLDDYRAGAAGAFSSDRPEPRGVLRGERLVEPYAAGLSLLVAPVYAVGGAVGVELLLAAITALGGALAYLLALRVVPDPWALATSVAVALAPPMIAYGTAVYPEPVCAAMLVGAALLAVDLDERPTRRGALGCFGLLALLPWLAVELTPAGLVIAVAAWRALGRSRRTLLRLAGLELVAVSATVLFVVNGMLYGGLTPYAAEAPGESPAVSSYPLVYASRAYRVVALLIDRELGLLRWAPVLALAVAGLWLLWHGRRQGLARAVPGYRALERTAGLCAVSCGATLLVAAFLVPTASGPWFPARYLVAVVPLMVPLAALGARRVPRVAAVLGLLTFAGSVWLYLDVRLGEGGLAADRPDAPWGPLEALFPSFGATAGPYVFAAVLAVAVIAVLVVDARRSRAGEVVAR